MKKFIKDGSMDVDVYLRLKKHAGDDDFSFNMHSILFKQKVTEPSISKEKIYSDIDAKTSGEVLPFHCPTISGSSIQLSLCNFSIAELKSIVNQKDIRNCYYLEDRVKRFRCSSPEKAQKIRDLLVLYDEQVERLFTSELSKGREITPELFYVDIKDRRKIVSIHMDYIGRNFVHAGSEFVFGTPTYRQLCNILESTSDRTRVPNALANRFVDMIAYYSTLDELETNPTNPPAIQRLVKG